MLLSIMDIYFDSCHFLFLRLSLNEIKCSFQIDYVDYGTNEIVPAKEVLNNVRYLHTQFADLCAQAIRCRLHGVEPREVESVTR